MRLRSMNWLTRFGLTFAVTCSFAFDASADDTDRSDGWKTATAITMVAGVATTTLMPRIFYADPETTAGWKLRWHVSVLAPTLANVSLTLLNEHALKDAIGGHRPGCDDTNQGQGRCQDYGSLSSHAFLAFSALGQGAVVVSSAAGLVTGALTGLTYAMLQRPECGYTGSLICW
jgi:hypothetical protein